MILNHYFFIYFNMKNKYNPKIYTLSAIILGYAMIGDYTANEQNAIGNWFMTIGQILESNSAIQQALEEKCMGNTYNINSKDYKNGGSPYMNNPQLLNYDSITDKEINEIKKMLNDLLDKLDNLF